MTGRQLQEALVEIAAHDLSAVLADMTGDDDTYVTEALSFAAEGVMTDEPGLVVRLSDHTEYQITIRRSR